MAAFFAGAAEIDITPPLGTSLAGLFHDRKADDVHDPLYAKALVLDNGGCRLALVSLDLISLLARDVTAIRARITEALGIPASHVIIGCTHTHTGPATRDSFNVPRDDAYCDWLVVRVADCVRLAARRLEPAKIAWGRGEQRDISFCRRYRMRDGTVRMNPGRGNPDIVEPSSPADPTVGVLYVEADDGSPLAVLTQFGMHYVGTDSDYAVSADYFADHAAILRRQLGARCVSLFLNGTSAQVSNVNPFDPDPIGGHRQGRRVATALAGEVLKVIGRLRPKSDCTLAALTTTTDLPRQPITDGDLAIAAEILAGRDPKPDNGPFSWVVGQPLPARLRDVYARHAALVAALPSTLPAEVQALRIADSAWVALPGEIFVEIGRAIKDASPAAATFVVGLANDSLGYIATDHAFLHEGGYETWASLGSPVGPGAEPRLVAAATALTEQLWGGHHG